ncbi:uncharacterized protein C2orf42 homolog isoform X1 [Thunnus albacares]|uniref:uncharacterized protein C2orf42 homolog isoform X1 n=1 Tax=Thunnus albacares TaxID=8236 RepID=UPI001CF6277A|nr:uncharacterized protein C2orf42 homolog isoform X1 [Thunnus albacares]
MTEGPKMETEITVTSSSSVVSPSTPQTTTAQANLAAKQRDSRKPTSTTPAFLSNLGRATLRGIRKCPQCGVYNGTRGLSCKNKACGISLRNASAGGGRNSKKGAVEVVRVIIDSEERGGKEREGGGVLGGGSSGGVQVFSVCHRGRGATATQLGFVELVPTDTAIATGDGATLLTRINLGRCFLPSCKHGQRSNQGESESAVANSKQSSDSLCIHIKQAIECRSCANPLTLKSSVLEGLQASMQAREELWGLATESPGPLVQRVSKDTLVVKCHTDSQHPLGLLHLTVGAGGLSEVSKSERRSREAQQQHAVFHCACQVSSRRGKPGADGAGGSNNSHPPPSSSQPCLHFYACVCAFASDEKLAAEFAAFINYTTSGVQQNATCRIISPSEKPLQQADPINSHHKAKKLRLDESLSAPSVASPAGVGKEGTSASGVRKAGQRKAPGAGGLKAPGSTQVVDEHTVTMGFHQWLAGVTERIHQTMHYQFDGKPEPLVYHIPQEFFNALQHRLSLGSKKRRLPNFTTAFVRNDGLPLGSFSKYTWHITNLMQVKRIFDTAELPLELTQSFVKNVDGSYSRFRCPEPPPEPELPEGYRTDRPQAIRPMELRTFLKVGPGTADQKEASPFVIEWIPDVLPRCQMGELRISFEFGHQQSGQPEYCEKMSAAEKGGRNKADSTQTKHSKAVEILQVVV